MADKITISVNGARISVTSGTTVAAAILQAGVPCRISVTGEPRGPICGMGVCFECRATINGTPHLRSCKLLCEPGMEIRTDG